MTHHPEYTLILPPNCPTNRDHLILADFPDLTREEIRACLAFAADRERRMGSVPPD